MKKIIFLLCFTLITFFAQAQSTTRFSVSGTIVDEKNTPIVGAAIVDSDNTSTGTISDNNGAYKLNLRSGTYSISVSCLGYEDATRSITLTKSTIENFTLQSDAKKIEEVVVSSRRLDDRINSVQIGAEKIVISEISKTPALFGEKDIVKSITYLPGVKAQGDGQSGYMVRGGSATQNLMLLDNAPLYNSGHAMGIFSVINGDALSEATLYKGLIPAQYGGAASSIFDIRSNTGDLNDHSFGVDVGVLAAKVLAEGAIVPSKLSFFVAARRSYFDLFLKLTEDYRETTMNFYDINGSLHYNINENNNLTLTIFNGGDHLALESMFDMTWGNFNGSLGWFHRYNSDLTSTTNFTHSGYDASTRIAIAGISIDIEGDISINGASHEFRFERNGHTLYCGIQSSLADITSADWTFNGFNERESRRAIESSAWINDEWKITPSLSLSAGLRLTNFLVMGGAPYYELDSDGKIDSSTLYDDWEVVKSYLMLEPRLSANYKISDSHSLKLGYARTSQNIYKIENNAMMIPFTRYTMASNNLRPQISDQLSLGYATLLKDQMFELSAETYYKITQNSYDYRDSETMTSEVEMEQILARGEGRAYGVELSAKKNRGVFTGWVGYTLAWAQTKIDGINNGEWYDASHDIRHSVSVVGMCGLSERWSVAAAWVLSSGKPLTAPSAKYMIGGETAYYYAERNGYRAPNYHRLDISFTNTKKMEKYTREWSFGAYNLYNQLNPFMISFEDDEDSASGSRAIQTSLYGILPSVSYSIKF